MHIRDAITLRQIKHTVKKVNSWAPRMRKMSNKELQGQTDILRQKLANGKSLEDILPQAYATVREVDYRLLGMFPYDVQVMGAIVLNSGNIAEMKTGEGKTLTATMPLYLNGLTGKGAMLVTPNSYLAARDEHQLAPVYNFLGLTSSLSFLTNDDQKENGDDPQVKKRLYSADIVYTTGDGLAFDYLFNNLKQDINEQYMPNFNYAVIDEVDAILLDGATSPFVVATKPQLLSTMYRIADEFVQTLIPKRDLKINRDEQTFWLTYKGIKKMERYFRIEGLFSEQHREIYRHVILAIRAHYFMRRGRDYLVVHGKVILLDETDGRLKKGIKVSTGLHQAIEQKEHVDLTPNMNTTASVTYPALFGLFNKVSGMSGTCKVNENEFTNVYGMRVIQIPTNRPMIRKDLPPKIYLTTREKLGNAIDSVIKMHEAGRPVLLVAGSVTNSEIISEILLNHGIPHNVLNAFNAAREAAIVKDAGQAGSVTVATNMAGRGTDIKLGPGVAAKGGLAVVGTEMLPKRVEQQLAGRAGRQGDPGTSQFYVSLEDDLVAGSSTDRMKKYYRKQIAKRRAGKPERQLKGIFTKLSLNLLRDRISSRNQMTRADINKYDSALRLQRHFLYQKRQQFMEQDHLEDVTELWLSEGIDSYLDQRKQWDEHNVKMLVNQHFTYNVVNVPQDVLKGRDNLKQYLLNLSHRILDKKTKPLTRNQINDFYRKCLLAAIDSCWSDQMDYLGHLRAITQPWGMAQRDPGYMYQNMALHSYEELWNRARRITVEFLILGKVSLNQDNELQVSFM